MIRRRVQWYGFACGPLISASIERRLVWRGKALDTTMPETSCDSESAASRPHQLLAVACAVRLLDFGRGCRYA